MVPTPIFACSPHPPIFVCTRNRSYFNKSGQTQNSFEINVQWFYLVQSHQKLQDFSVQTTSVLRMKVYCKTPHFWVFVHAAFTSILNI